MALTLGFASDVELRRHHQKHMSEFGPITLDEYLARADSFLGSPLAAGVHECTRSNGQVLRYNPVTNEFGILTPERRILTYYKPNPWNRTKYPTNLDYFMEQCKK